MLPDNKLSLEFTLEELEFLYRALCFLEGGFGGKEEIQLDEAKFKVRKALSDFDQKIIQPTKNYFSWDTLPYSKELLQCNHCGQKTPMKVICEKRIDETLAYLGEPASSIWINWKILKCPLCNQVNVYEIYSIADEEDFVVDGGKLLTDSDDEPRTKEVIHIKSLFPVADLALPKPHPKMPINVLEDYEEARKVYPVSARSAAALLRLAIQKLCIYLGEEGKKIDSDIASLVRKGLSEHIQQALDIVRVIGNESVHPGEINVQDNPDIAKQLFDLVNLVIEDRIGSTDKRAKIGEIYNNLPQSKREGIKKRDGKA